MKLPIRILSILLMLLTYNAVAQQTSFQMQLLNTGNDMVDAVCENSSGNFILASESFNGLGYQDIAISEISATGVVIQSTSVSTGLIMYPKSVFETTYGNYIVTGAVQTNNVNSDWFVAKFDASLNLIWYKTYGDPNLGNDYANHGFEISPGHYCITGTAGIGGSAKPSVVTLDSSGAILQQGFLNTNQFASPRYAGRYLGNGKIAMIQLANAITIVDTVCNVIQNFPNSFGTYSVDAAPTNDGGYMIVSLGSFGSPTGSKMTLSHLDSTLSGGSFTIQFGANGYDFEPVAVKQDSSGNYWVACNVISLGSGASNGIVVKLDNTGNVIWSNSYSPVGSAGTFIRSMIETSDGGYLIAGRLSSALERMFVAKLDSSGLSSCNTTPYPVTPQAAVSVPRSPHIPYIGLVNELTPSPPLASASNITGTIICITTGINDVDNAQPIIRAYPNPATKSLTVVIPEELSNSSFEIIDISGKIVRSFDSLNSRIIDVSDLSCGTYYLRSTKQKNQYTTIIIN